MIGVKIVTVTFYVCIALKHKPSTVFSSFFLKLLTFLSALLTIVSLDTIT